MKQNRVIKRAILSVSDKTGIIEFASELRNLGIEILSTGGTYKMLRSNDLEVKEVSSYTQFPEMMDGRVKTLHPKIHGGILGRRGVDDEVMKQEEINTIDLVVVNLYPFEQTIKKQDCLLIDAIENIDIGGPTMIRAAAKNYMDVTVVVDNEDYKTVINALQSGEKEIDLQTRFQLMTKAFEHTAHYDSMIANYFGTKTYLNETSKFPSTFNVQYKKKQIMRYGENPHQDAAFFIEHDCPKGSIGATTQLQGKELSFNNIADADAALECVKQFDTPSCVIVKHANPCGVASADNLINAYDLAYETDPESAFGGIIAFNGELNGETAERIINRQFIEVIIAPSISRNAEDVLAKKENIRLLKYDDIKQTHSTNLDFKKVSGGLLIQDIDAGMINEDKLRVVTKVKPSELEIKDMLFAWKVAKMVKSNAIVYARNQQTIGVGAGQMSRVNSARIAAIKAEHAGLQVKNSAMASDAFFPFRDAIDNAAKIGISCIIQPGGSVRDDEVIRAADEYNIKMVFTSMRHFRH